MVSVARDGKPERLPFVGEDGVMPVVSRSQPVRPARLVYVRSSADGNILRIDTSAAGAPTTSQPVVSVSSSKIEGQPDISPDGRRVAFTSNRSGVWEIWVSDLDGSNAVQLTWLGAQLTAVPRWSPDGQVITFASDVEGQMEIYVIAAAGGKPRRLTSHPGVDHVPSFSRDGKWIYFGSSRTGQNQVWKIPVSGGDAAPVTRDGGFISFESPDGAYLYYSIPAAAVGMSMSNAVWRLPVSGGRAVKILENVHGSVFGVLERGIYYVEIIKDEGRLQFYDFALRRSTTVARKLGDVFFAGGLAASTDGRTILYSLVASSVDDLMLVENFR